MYVPDGAARKTSAPLFRLCALPLSPRPAVAREARSASSSTVTSTSASFGSCLSLINDPTRAIRLTPGQLRARSTNRKTSESRKLRIDSSSTTRVTMFAAFAGTLNARVDRRRANASRPGRACCWATLAGAAISGFGRPLKQLQPYEAEIGPRGRLKLEMRVHATYPAPAEEL